MDLGIWRPTNGTWFILTSTTGYSYAQARVRQWGSPGDKPVPADYDGDGSSDIAVWRPASGVWFILRSWLNSSPASTVCRAMGHWVSRGCATSGDFDGDGVADPTVWRPGTGTWFMLRSTTRLAGYLSVQWGLAHSMIVHIVDDYNGDRHHGFCNLAAIDVRASLTQVATWFVLGTNLNFFFNTQWGSSLHNDVPLPREPKSARTLIAMEG